MTHPAAVGNDYATSSPKGKDARKTYVFPLSFGERFYCPHLSFLCTLHIMSSIESYRLKLAAMPAELRGETHSRLVPWIYTNDQQFFSIIPKLRDASRGQRRDSKTRVAVFCTAGSFLCLAPYIHADFFLSIDSNGFVIDRIKETVESIKQSDLPSEYVALAESNEYFKQMKYHGIDAREYWLMERASFGERHFLASLHNYKLARIALLSHPVLYVQGNLSFPPFIHALAEIFRDAVIPYINITDLHEWSPEIPGMLSQLPLTSDAIVSWSTNMQQDGFPVARLSQGYEHFLREVDCQTGIPTVQYFKKYQ